MMQDKPLHLLITSVGSLVGQNVIEGLAQQRRHYRLTGINSIANAASNFLCDRVYLAPALDTGADFMRRFDDIVDKERPDLIIPGRDDDVVFLSSHSELPVMVGPSVLAATLRDKWNSYRFARRHGLPFARTLTSDDGFSALTALAEESGWPLVAKPRKGHSSRGVVLVGAADELAVAASWPDYCFQPWLGEKLDLQSLKQSLRGGLPLGWSLPQSKISMDGWITPDGQIGGLFCTLHEQVVLGRSERVSRLDSPQADAILQRYANALRQDGWRGIFNIQLAQDRHGNLQAFEMNGRFTGSAATLRMLGLDFVHGAIAAFSGHSVQPLCAGSGRVEKRLANWAIPDAAIDALNVQGAWTASKQETPL